MSVLSQLVSGSTTHFLSGSTLTIDGSVGGTPTGGTLDLTAVTLTIGTLTIHSATLVHTTTTFTDGAASQAATLTNSPLAGDPTKWIAINDNGVTRHIPAW